MQMSNSPTFTVDNRFVKELPADPVVEEPPFPRSVAAAAYSWVKPRSFSKPRLVGLSVEAAALIDLDPDTSPEVLAGLFSGQQLIEGSRPYAMNYGGHQFGNWAGQLGDGRAINLAEVVNGNGQHWALQLKGAGPTPYSRGADGFAVLRSSIREFLCSEAMHHLGVPTTRALSLVTTGEQVIRDMFYNGNRKPEPGAVVCRLAPSFIRFGHFQLPASRGDQPLLKQYADYVLKHHFQNLGAPSAEAYGAMFKEICVRTTELIIHWERVGFVHGVMNTDNMSILGLTIDYGPYGWIDNYDPDWTPNTTDAEGRRYRFGNQASVALWNLAQLAQALYPLIGAAEPLEEGLEEFQQNYPVLRRQMRAAKLGLSEPSIDDDLLFDRLWELLTEVETDMTLFFRALAAVDLFANPEDLGAELVTFFSHCYYRKEELTAAYQVKLAQWFEDYRATLQRAGIGKDNPSLVATRVALMNHNNPKYLLRNYLAQQVIDAAENGDYHPFEELLSVIKKPYDEQPGNEHYAVRRPEWARSRPGCSMLSCSS